MPFAIKAEVPDPHAETFVFRDQKTMYGGKCIAAGDEVFIFASEHAGGAGLVAAGVVAEANSVARTVGVARQTPRVSVTVYRTRSATRPLGRRELKPFADWSDAGPETELNFKFYRQATNKIIGVTAETAKFLGKFF